MKPESRRYWDIIFTFSGADVITLKRAVKLSTFVYEFNIDGVLNSLETTTNVEDLPPPAQNCSNGELLGGICYFKTNDSCTDACSAIGSTPHPSVTNVIGSSDEGNLAQCQNLYRALDGDPTIEVRTVNTGNGYGCHVFMNRYWLDTSATDPTSFPPLGGNRLCSCDTQLQ